MILEVMMRFDELAQLQEGDEYSNGNLMIQDVPN